ncbi:MAG: hypothetical protein KF773_35825 [Deltaproteobacteria bacterium]|nr:hypothetical protein [Deltaproteobacteria bacterium]
MRVVAGYAGMLLAFASGCHVLFEAEPIPLAPCGAFGAPVPQAFDPALGRVTELSVDATGVRGMVRSTTPMVPRGRVIAVELAGGAWRADPARVANLAALENEFRLAFARVSPSGDMFAAELPTDDFAYRVFRWTFDGVWKRQESVTPQLANESTYPGGEVEVAAGAGELFRTIPIVHEDDNLVRFLAIAVSNPPALPWAEALLDGHQITEQINAAHDVRSAALAVGPSGRLVLAYAATARGQARGSRLYLVEKIFGVFAAGERVRDVEVKLALRDGEELVEPWLAEGCSALYFRRTASADDAGTIYMSARVDPSPTSQ